jgi:hypothetical protein
MRFKTFGEAWAKFEARVLPPTAPAVQRIEMRRAFYTGLSVAMEMMLEAPDEYTTERQAAEFLHGLTREIEAFGEKVDRGIA